MKPALLADVNRDDHPEHVLRLADLPPGAELENTLADVPREGFAACSAHDESPRPRGQVWGSAHGGSR